MHGCNLRSIKKEWFSSLNKLEDLDLSNNHIDILELTAFKNLKELKKLNCHASSSFKNGYPFITFFDEWKIFEQKFI